MRYLRMAGLAGLAAVAVTMSVGAAAASADEVCTESAVSNMCPAGKAITTVESSQIGTGVLETIGGTELISCKAGDTHITITSQGTGVDPILASVGGIKFTECTGTLTTINNGTGKGTTVGTNGVLTSVGAEVTTGILGTTCTYGTGTGTTLGTTNNTRLTINTIVKRTAGGFLCPSEARLTAETQITNHNKVVWINN